MIATKHKVFCSYTLGSESVEKVDARMRAIADAFESAGVESYCNLFDMQTYNLTCPKDCLDIALNKLEECDIVFVVMTGERSEGMLIEVGVAYAAGKQIVLARHESANGKTYVDRMANITMDWQTDQDLTTIIKSLIIKPSPTPIA